MSEKERFSVSMDADIVEWIDSQTENRSAFLANLAKRARDGRSEIDTALTEAEIQRVEKRINAAEAELEAERAYLDQLREQKQEAQQAEQSYEDALTDILDSVEATDGHVWESSQDVINLVDEYGTSARHVLDDLKQKAAGEGRDLTTHNFMAADEARLTAEEPRPITEVVGDE